MNNYYGNREVFYYHISGLEKNKTDKKAGTFWITSNYGFLKCVGTYQDFIVFCKQYCINPYFAD